MAVDDEVQAGDDDVRGFDPRFDPAFQRGYRPTPGEQARTRLRGVPAGTGAASGRQGTASAAGVAPAASAAPAATAAPAASVASTAGVAWEAETVGVPAGSLEYGDGARPLVTPEHAAAAERAAAMDALPPAAGGAPMPVPGSAPGFLDRIDTSPRTNRRVLALWLIGAGFVVLGIVLYVVSVFTSYTNPTPNSDVSGLVFSQLGWMLAGPLVTVGLATLVTMTLLTAFTARRAPIRTAGEAAARGDEASSGDDA